MAWQPTQAGPKTLRALYHWVWGQLNAVGELIGSDFPPTSPPTPVPPPAPFAHSHYLDNLINVDIDSPEVGQMIVFDGTEWINVDNTTYFPLKPSGQDVLLVFSGQSNGIGSDIGTGGNTSNPNVLSWNSDGAAGGQARSFDWEVVDLESAEKLDYSNGNLYSGIKDGDIGHMGWACADHIQKVTGRTVYIVCVAHAEQPISEWLNGGPMQVELEQRVADALLSPELSGIAQADGMLWMQGESDAQRLPEDYIADWEELRDNCEAAGWCGRQYTQWVLGETADNWEPFIGMKRTQAALDDQQDEFTRVVRGVSLTFEDPPINTHYDGDSHQHLGVAMGKSVLAGAIPKTRVEAGRALWKEPYILGALYQKDDMVQDRGWTMIANIDTVDRPSPTPTGPAAFLYEGANPASDTTVKQVVFGTRYEWSSGGWVAGYRVYVVPDQHYTVYSVQDPTGIPLVKQIADFTADTTGWVTIATEGALIIPGTVLDLIAVVSEPDGTPTEWTGDWDYIKPNNAAIPATGEAVHATKAISELLVHKTDDNGNTEGDRAPGEKLLDLENGDVITLDSTTWSVQTVTDDGAYVTIGIAPATQALVSGVNTFTFGVVTATPITRMLDTDYYLSDSAISGLYIEDDDYSNIVPDDNAYGMDVYVQPGETSPDWDVLAISESAGDVGLDTGVSGDLGISGITGNRQGITRSEVSTTGATWTDITNKTLLDGKVTYVLISVSATRTDGTDYYVGAWRVLAWNDGGAITIDDDNDLELGNVLLAVRVIAGTDEIITQVKGFAMQDWNFKMTSIYSGN